MFFSRDASCLIIVCANILCMVEKMSRQALSTANDSQSSKRTVRKWSYDEDVMLVSCMVDLHNIENYNVDIGFKTGYLLELERMMVIKLPNAYIKGKPHIESRIKMLKKRLEYNI